MGMQRERSMIVYTLQRVAKQGKRVRMVRGLCFFFCFAALSAKHSIYSYNNKLCRHYTRFFMNFLDLVFCVIAAYFLLRGLFRGFVIEIAGIAGVVLGFFVANKYHPELMPVVQRFLDAPGWSATVAYLAIFIGCIIVATLMARMLDSMIQPMAGALNRFAGGMVGLVKAVLICVVVFMVLSHYLPTSQLVTKAQSAAFLQQTAAKLRPLLPDVSIPMPQDRQERPSS